MPPPKKRRKLLSNTRPYAVSSTSTPSSKATRSLIRTHHTLRKQHAAAVRQNDHIVAASVASQLDDLGGLESYQAASIIGQSIERGGDSSKILVDWIRDATVLRRENRGEGRLRLLEVGALKVDNACSRSGLFEVERIDLNSREEGIKQQDFLERTLPSSDNERFDVLSLSLVLNFVPEAEARGNMLQRSTSFLTEHEARDRLDDKRGRLDSSLPCLFLVLPAPCVANSRYLDDQRLESIMNALGYMLAKRKMTAKLVYYLWTWKSKNVDQSADFKKIELRSGKSRNNFAIVLRKSTS